LIPQEQFVAIANDIWAAMALIFGQQCHRDPPRLIAAFETYASPTIAKPFGLYRKLLPAFPFRLARQSFMLEYTHSGGAVASAGFAQYLLAALPALPTDPGATSPLGGFTSLPVFKLMYLP
jgi:hypothetical protein